MKPTSISKNMCTDLTTTGWEDYELIDSGGFRKLERFGNHQLIRNEPAAEWHPALPQSRWDQANATFTLNKGQSNGIWHIKENTPRDWVIRYKNLSFNLFLAKSRHIGIFPEQHLQWDWVMNKIGKSARQLSVLNLFGYTGAATLAAVKSGALVTHVDASRSAVERAKGNYHSSGFSEQPIRWLIDDAHKFVQREIRRGKHYDAIIMDPPNFGRGPGGEVWKFEKMISVLLFSSIQILSENPAFVILTAYNVDHPSSELGVWLADIMNSFHGKTTNGNLIQQEKSAGRKIHQAIYALWENN